MQRRVPMQRRRPAWALALLLMLVRPQVLVSLKELVWLQELVSLDPLRRVQRGLVPPEHGRRAWLDQWMYRPERGVLQGRTRRRSWRQHSRVARAERPVQPDRYRPPPRTYSCLPDEQEQHRCGQLLRQEFDLRKCLDRWQQSRRPAKAMTCATVGRKTRIRETAKSSRMGYGDI